MTNFEFDQCLKTHFSSISISIVKKKLLIKKDLDLDDSDLWLHLPSVYILWRYKNDVKKNKRKKRLL